MSIGNLVAVLSLLAVLPFTKEKVSITWRVIAGGVLSVAGACAIALS